MPIKTGDTALDEQLRVVLGEMVQQQQDSARSSIASIRESAVHDFSAYQFILEPLLLRTPTVTENHSGGSSVDGTNVPVGDWIDFEAFVDRFKTHFQAMVERWLVESGVEVDRDLSGYSTVWRPSDRLTRVVEPTIRQAREGFRAGMAPALFRLYRALIDRADRLVRVEEINAAKARAERFANEAVETVAAWLNGKLQTMRGDDGSVQDSTLRLVRYGSFWADGVSDVLSQLGDFVDDVDTEEGDEGDWKDVSLELPSSYEFEPFLPFSINFGIQTIYRQAWIPLGTQTGEIVRTLPLGPKQTEKVTVKAIRRTKATRQSEIATSIESSTESSAATKDSSEVMQEASESFNWHAEASASASFGFGSASITAGAGGENASGSRDTKSMLNETMEKTSSKIRKDTKIVVTTETEQTDEFSQVSEITNPNDEIAVTYIYSRLQRQYELQSYLAEVNAVIYVAENIPVPSEINGLWVRRYDWIIAQALLDESFRADLEVVKNYELDHDSEDIDENIGRLMGTLSGESAPGIPDYSSLTGDLNMPDLFSNQQQAYERELERKRARDSNQDQYRRSVRRLGMHIYDNVLHYCRAIWSAEDPDARLLRYRDIRVPTKWDPVSNSSSNSSAGITITPAVTDEENHTASLSDMINPVGPIGFAGNYSVFYLRESTKWHSLNDVIRLVQTPYREMNVHVETNLTSGATAVVSDLRMGPGFYKLTLLSTETLMLRIEERVTQNSFSFVADKSLDENNTLAFHSIMLKIESPSELSTGDNITIELRMQPYLEDPEVKAIRWSEFKQGSIDESHFTLDVVQEMRDFFEVVRLALINEAFDVAFDSLSTEHKALLREYYYDHLVRRRYTRRILVDTNNVLLTREVDTTSTLEPYKEMHRLLDVLKTGEALSEQRLENERRKLRIEANLLGDPSIDKLTVVAGTKSMTDLAPLDGLEEDPVNPDV
jgi:hypothetical protein